MFSLYDRAEASLPDWQKKLLDNCMCFLFQNKPKNKQTYTHADIWTRKIPAKSQQTQQSQTQMKWGCDHPSCNRNLINCKLSPNKKKKRSRSRLQRDTNPWPLHPRFSSLPTELWRLIQANLLSLSDPRKEWNMEWNDVKCGNTDV